MVAMLATMRPNTGRSETGSSPWSWKAATYSSLVAGDAPPATQRRQAAATSRPTVGASACIHRGWSARVSSRPSTVMRSIARTTRPTTTPVAAANSTVWWVRRPIARASSCRWAGSSQRDEGMRSDIRTPWQHPRPPLRQAVAPPRSDAATQGRASHLASRHTAIARYHRRHEEAAAAHRDRCARHPRHEEGAERLTPGAAPAFVIAPPGGVVTGAGAVACPTTI